MGLKQSMRQSMGMTMTPQLQTAIKILQMSVMELQQEVTNALVENPALEEIEGDEDRELDAAGDEAVGDKTEVVNPENPVEPVKDPVQEMKEDFDWQSYIENSSQMGPPSTRNASSDEFPTYDQVLSRPVTLADHLLKQLRHFTSDPRDLLIGEEIIGNLNDDGYLSLLVEEIAVRAEVSVDEVLSMLRQIQGFDPPGVGARDLKECLLLQADALHLGPQAKKMIQEHLPELENKNYPAIAKKMEISLDKVIELSRLVHRLEPKPGRAYHSGEPYYIVPDVYVVQRGGKWEVLLNEDGLPRLRVSRMYKEMMAEGGFSGDAKKYLKEKIKDAAWLLKSLDQRQRTIYRVADVLVRKQIEFFEKGPSQLKPMILRDVADELGLHESTVSRVTTNKYIHTSYGIFELKYFFGSGVSASDGGEDMAAESVRLKIKQLIEAEDSAKPLSDQDLVKLLEDQNIKIARRTVAKYREAMNVLPSNKRKKYF